NSGTNERSGSSRKPDRQGSCLESCTCEWLNLLNTSVWNCITHGLRKREAVRQTQVPVLHTGPRSVGRPRIDKCACVKRLVRVLSSPLGRASPTWSTLNGKQKGGH